MAGDTVRSDRSMTKEELRIAVAEERGWERKELSERDPGGAIHRYYTWIRVDNDGDEEERLRLPDYLDSMDACMPLLEEMGERGYVVTLWSKFAYNQIDIEWWCYLTLNTRKSIIGQGEPLCIVPRVETPMIAICKMYLSWKSEHQWGIDI